MNTLSIQRPRPSIEMRTPAAISMPVKAALVNWLPWSVLKMSGRPKRGSASCSAATQNEPSMVADLGVQPFDLTLVAGRAIAVAAFEGPCRLLQKLLLPGG